MGRGSEGLSRSLSQAVFWEQQAWDTEEINLSCPCISPLPPTPLAIHRALSTGRSACIQEVPSSYNYPQLANEVCRGAGPPARTRVCASLPVLVVGTAVVVIAADLGFHLSWHLSLPSGRVMQTCLQHLSSAVYSRAVNPPSGHQKAQEGSAPSNSPFCGSQWRWFAPLDEAVMLFPQEEGAVPWGRQPPFAVSPLLLLCKSYCRLRGVSGRQMNGKCSSPLLAALDWSLITLRWRFSRRMGLASGFPAPLIPP